MSKKLKYSEKILGLDVSTKTIGFALIDKSTKSLLELTHFTPKIKPKPDDKMEELLMKALAFEQLLDGYKNIGITKVVIEEPLLHSNNLYTVATLLRYNTLIFKACHTVLGVIPNYISTYDARKNAFPILMSKNVKGNETLFGAYPKDTDKKRVIWELVNELFPDIMWQYDKKGKMKIENYDMADAVTTVIGYMNYNEKEPLHVL